MYNITEERSHHVVVMMPTKKGTTQQAQDVCNSWEFSEITYEGRRYDQMIFTHS